MANNTNGLCANCCVIFDVQKAVASFPGLIRGKKIHLIFGLCPKCHFTFQEVDHKQKSTIVQTSFYNVINNQSAGWVLVNSLTLFIHCGNFFSAWWLGIDVPRTIYEGIDAGLIDEFVIFPSSLGVYE